METERTDFSVGIGDFFRFYRKTWRKVTPLEEYDADAIEYPMSIVWRYAIRVFGRKIAEFTVDSGWDKYSARIAVFARVGLNGGKFPFWWDIYFPFGEIGPFGKLDWALFSWWKKAFPMPDYPDYEDWLNLPG